MRWKLAWALERLGETVADLEAVVEAAVKRGVKCFARWFGRWCWRGCRAMLRTLAVDDGQGMKPRRPELVKGMSCDETREEIYRAKLGLGRWRRERRPEVAGDILRRILGEVMG